MLSFSSKSELHPVIVDKKSALLQSLTQLYVTIYMVMMTSLTERSETI